MADRQDAEIVVLEEEGVQEEEQERSHSSSASGVSPSTLADFGLGIRRLSRLRDFRLEQTRIYRALASGNIGDKQAGRLMWMVDVLRRAKETEEKLELVQAGVLDNDAPFGGLTIVHGERPAKPPQLINNKS